MALLSFLRFPFLMAPGLAPKFWYGVESWMAEAFCVYFEDVPFDLRFLGGPELDMASEEFD